MNNIFVKHWIKFVFITFFELFTLSCAWILSNTSGTSTVNKAFRPVYEWGLFGLNLKKNRTGVQYKSILLLLKNWKRKTSCNLVYKISDYGRKRLCYTPVRRWLFVVVVLSTRTSYQLPISFKPFFQKKVFVPNIWPQAHYVEYGTSFFLPTD